MEKPTLNLPFTGIATFAKVRHHSDLNSLSADVAIIGAPYDLGTQVRSGTRLGPRGIRAASTIYGLRTVEYYDPEFDTLFLHGVTIIDCGDVDMVHARPEICLQNIEDAIGLILEREALPVTLGGDHSISIPVMRAFAPFGPLYVVQIDAHLDFVNERFGVREGHGNVMRRMVEMDHVAGIAHIGIRGPGSSDPADFRDAKEMGNLIVGPREFRRSGVESVLSRIPDDRRYYVTIDCDAFDPALMPGSGSPSPGGFTYHEVTDFLYGLASKGTVAGFDFVEVNPHYDPTEVTQQTAARIILDFLGAIFTTQPQPEADAQVTVDTGPR